MTSHNICLMMGDPSGDGHKITDTFDILSNLTEDQIKKSYEKGSKIVGFDLVQDICADYEDNHLHTEYIEKFKEAGIDAKEYADEWQGSYTLHTEGFAELYLNIVKLGNPKFEWKKIESPAIDIGGYGMFK